MRWPAAGGLGTGEGNSFLGGLVVVGGFGFSVDADIWANLRVVFECG